MARVLIFNDRKAQGEIQEENLGAAGHVTQVVVEQSMARAVASLQRHLILPWDVLVLDIHIKDDDHFGGIWIYNQLIRVSSTKNWKHTIIFTQHVSVEKKLEEATFGGHDFVVRVFADTAGIPFENVLSNELDTQLALVAKIKELVP